MHISEGIIWLLSGALTILRNILIYYCELWNEYYIRFVSFFDGVRERKIAKEN